MFNYFNHLIKQVSSFTRFNKAILELNALSDKELNDIGITRSEIVYQVYKSTLNNYEIHI